jgi:pyridoxal phosphate enzyme (YggS family)
MNPLAVSIQESLREVRTRVRNAELAWGRAPGSVQLLAVSKTFGLDAISAAWMAGQTSFGENYVQEGLQKIEAMPEALLTPGPEPRARGPIWHFIGPLQSNKTRAVAEHFDWVHTVDRERIGQRLSEQRPESRGPLQVCIQVNVSGESSKSGVAPQDALALVESLLPLAGLRVRGLMVIPEALTEFSEQRAEFARARQLFESISTTLARVPSLASALGGWDTLSMGMSADLEAAIAEGATIVRVGSAIFGSRTAGAESV